MTKRLAPICLTAWLLWTSGSPETPWLILHHYETAEQCYRAIQALRDFRPVTRDEVWDLRCYPIGVHPKRVHPWYGWIRALPEA
jgi:hypothetical protein